MVYKYDIFAFLFLLQLASAQTNGRKKAPSRFSVPLLPGKNCSHCEQCQKRCLFKYFCDLSFNSNCSKCGRCVKNCVPEAGCALPSNNTETWDFAVESVILGISVAEVLEIRTRSFTAKLRVNQHLVVPGFQYGYTQWYMQSVLEAYFRGDVEATKHWPAELEAETEKEPYKSIFYIPGETSKDPLVDMFGLQMRADDTDAPMDPSLGVFFRRESFDFGASIHKGDGKRRLNLYGLWQNADNTAAAFLDNVSISWGEDESISFPFIIQSGKFPFDEQKLAIDIFLPFIPGASSSFADDHVPPPVTFAPTTEDFRFPGLSKSAVSSWPGDWEVLKSDTELGEYEGSYRLSLQIYIRRRSTYMFIRYFIPLWMMAGASITAFFVRPEQAMPRFAATYIAFLSLQGFRMYSQNLIPGGSTVTWIDALNFHAASFAFICIIANTVTQVILEKFSPFVAYRFDKFCRFFLLTTYIGAEVMIFLLADVDPLALIGIVGGWTGIVLFFLVAAVLATSRNLHLNVLRHYAVTERHMDLDHREARLIFKRLDTDNSGTVSAIEMLLSIREALGRKRCPLSDDELLAVSADVAIELRGACDGDEEFHMDVDDFVKGHKQIVRAVTSRLQDAVSRKERVGGGPADVEEMETFTKQNGEEDGPSPSEQVQEADNILISSLTPEVMGKKISPRQVERVSLRSESTFV